MRAQNLEPQKPDTPNHIKWFAYRRFYVYHKKEKTWQVTKTRNGKRKM